MHLKELLIYIVNSKELMTVFLQMKTLTTSFNFSHLDLALIFLLINSLKLDSILKNLLNLMRLVDLLEDNLKWRNKTASNNKIEINRVSLEILEKIRHYKSISLKTQQLLLNKIFINSLMKRNHMLHIQEDLKQRVMYKCLKLNKWIWYFYEWKKH